MCSWAMSVDRALIYTIHTFFADSKTHLEEIKRDGAIYEPVKPNSLIKNARYFNYYPLFRCQKMEVFVVVVVFKYTLCTS